MAVLSMTGFGTASARQPNVEIDVTIKTFNSRFLEIKTHLPREFLEFESDVKTLLKKSFGRGTVDVYVNRKILAGAKTKTVVLNEGILREYLGHLKQIQKKYRVQGDVAIEHVFRMDGVFSVEESTPQANNESRVLMKTVQVAAKKVAMNRQREGRSLHVELERLLGSLEAQSKILITKIAETQTARKEKLISRLKGLTDASFDNGRLAQEIAIQVEKYDVQEEVVRFSTHIEYCSKLLSGKESPGKSLDFYSQELLREINTIGSKVSSAEIANIVVKTKTLIDQLKEQVLNIE
jgi:uncharacterized protein (TIGR00255 family)